MFYRQNILHGNMIFGIKINFIKKINIILQYTSSDFSTVIDNFNEKNI